MATPTRKPYDPGTPGECIYQGHGVFLVQSHHTEDAYYSVDLHAGTCTCPHAMKRDPEGGCKHYRLALAEMVGMVAEKARAMTIRQLKEALAKRPYLPAIREAVEGVIWEKLAEMVNVAPVPSDELLPA